MFYRFPSLVTCIQYLSKLHFLNRLAYLHICKFQGVDIYKKIFNFFESKEYLNFPPQLNSLIFLKTCGNTPYLLVRRNYFLESKALLCFDCWQFPEVRTSLQLAYILWTGLVLLFDRDTSVMPGFKGSSFAPDFKN